MAAEETIFGEIENERKWRNNVAAWAKKRGMAQRFSSRGRRESKNREM